MLAIFRILSEFFRGIKQVKNRIHRSWPTVENARSPIIFIDFHDRGLEHFYPIFFVSLQQGGASLVFNKRNLRFLGSNEGSFSRFWRSATFEILSLNEALSKYHNFIYLWDTECRVPKNLRYRIKCGYLNTDYFSQVFIGRNNKGIILPVGVHPNFSFGTIPIDEVHERARISERVIGVLFAGNISAESYSSPALRRYFGVPSRLACIEALEKESACSMFHTLGGHLDINSLKKLMLLNKIVLNVWGNKNSKFCVEKALSEYDWISCILGTEFFLALPGCQVPFTWSLNEAMCAGAIPIIHCSYASLMSPELEDSVNCIMFKSLEELFPRIQFALALSADAKSKLRSNVLGYYNKNLSSSSIVEKLVATQATSFELYMMAETRSLTQFVQKKAFS